MTFKMFRTLLFCVLQLVILVPFGAEASNYNFGVPSSNLGSPLFQLGDSIVDNSREFLLQHLEVFLDHYYGRPDKNNKCGVRINHAFAIYMVATKLQPTAIIESGINAGVSTYFFRKACPKAKIISIDPEVKPVCGQQKRWIDETNNVYLVGDTFQDISEVNWADFPDVDPKTTLVYNDDHMNAFSRLPILQKKGFVHFMLEDNYSDQKGITKVEVGNSVKSVLQRRDDKSQWLLHNLVSYQEIPPVMFGKNILSDVYHQKFCRNYFNSVGAICGNSTNLATIAKPMLMTDDSEEDHKLALHIRHRLGLNFKKNFDQYVNYCWISFYELKPYGGE